MVSSGKPSGEWRTVMGCSKKWENHLDADAVSPGKANVVVGILRRSPGTESVKDEEFGKAGEQLQNAGLYIGWLERFLILTALLLRSPAAVGLILTAKAITRYPEFKSVRFAEYVLIGTLLSVSLAFVGAVFLAWLFLGTARVSG